MRRVLVVGISGAGKSTPARALGRQLGLPFHELDALHFTGPGWAVSRTFAEDTARVGRTERWIFDSLGYPAVRDLLWERADTVVWLDYSRYVVMRRVLLRSLRRSLLRERLFGGNRESWREWLRGDHPAWWAWTQYEPRRAEIRRRESDPLFAPLRVVRLRSPRAAEAWLCAQEPPQEGPGRREGRKGQEGKQPGPGSSAPGRPDPGAQARRPHT